MGNRCFCSLILRAVGYHEWMTITEFPMAAVMTICLVCAASPALAQPVTTVISHGFSTGDKGAWVQGMAEAVIARAGEGSIYRYTGATGVWTFVSGDGSSDVLALIFNWVPESDAPDSGPKRAIAVATASSKKLLAPISAPGAATEYGTRKRRMRP